MNSKSLTLLLVLLVGASRLTSATPRRSQLPVEIAELLEIGVQDLAFNIAIDGEDHIGHGVPVQGDDEEDDELDEEIHDFSGPTYINSIDKLEEIGINASAIDTNILEDTFLTAVRSCRSNVEIYWQLK